MSEVDRPCPNCGHTLNGCSGLRSYGTYQTHDTAYCLRYLRDDRATLRAQLAEAQAQVQTARDALREAIALCDWDTSDSELFALENKLRALIQTTEPRPDAAKEE